MPLFDPPTNGCPSRQHCPGCAEEMIHRDHRKRWESSSGFGQIFLRDYGHGRFGAADADLVVERRADGPGGLPLLMVFEHKEPMAKIEFSQRTILRRVAIVVHDAILGHRLDPQSGVFTIRGRIGARTTGYRETYFDGPQVIERMLPRLSDLANESWTVNGQDALFRWIDARMGFTPEGRKWRSDA